MGNPLSRFRKVEDIKAGVKLNTSKRLTQSGEVPPEATAAQKQKDDGKQGGSKGKTTAIRTEATARTERVVPPLTHREEDLSHQNVKTDWGQFKKTLSPKHPPEKEEQVPAAAVVQDSSSSSEGEVEEIVLGNSRRTIHGK